MNTTSLVLKPAILTSSLDHNYASTLPRVTTGNNNRKHTLEDNNISPPNKKFVTDPINYAKVDSMDLSNADPDNLSINDFEPVRNRKSKSSSSRIQSPNQRYKTVIQNRFEPISTPSDDNNVTASPKSQSIPPIFLHDSNNYQALIADLDNVLQHDYYTVNKGTSIKINVSTSDDFRALTAHFDSVNVPYHSFCPPDNKRLSVIMRNIPLSLSDEEIYNELTSKNYPVLKVSRLFNKDKYPMPLCAIELEDSDIGNEIFSLEFLFHSKIQIELKRKSKSIPQCTRCQRFGHTKNYCKLQPRCVKCTGNHLYSECSKKKEDSVQCVNCGDSHTANYRGCPYFLNLKSRSKQNKNILTSESTQNVETFNTTFSNFPPLKTNEGPLAKRNQKGDNIRSPRVNYASVVNGAQPKRPENNMTDSSHVQPENDSLHPIFNSLLTLIKPYIPQIKSFISELISSIFKNGF